MHGVLHLSDSTYKNDQHLEKSVEHYPVGYHLYYGTVTDTPAKKSKAGSLGYGSGNAVSVNHIEEGCIHSQQGVLTSLLLIIDCFNKGITSLVVLTTDPYLSRVATQWMPSWELAAVKGNHQTIPHDKEWLEVKNLGVTFVEIIEPTFGTNLADVYSLSYLPWQSKLPPVTVPVQKLDPLFWLPTKLFKATEHTAEHYLVKASEHLEIGNMDTNTVYGVVRHHEEVMLVTQLCHYSALTAHRAYTLNLSALTSDKTGSILSTHGTHVLSRLNIFENTWSLGRNVPVLSEIDPPQKLYKSYAIFDALETVVNMMYKTPVDQFNFDKNLINIVEVTDEVFPAGNVSPLILSGQAIKLTMPIGKPRKVTVGTEIPHANACRALLKKRARFFTVWFNMNGIGRYMLAVKHDTGCGVYTPWLTKLS